MRDYTVNQRHYKKYASKLVGASCVRRLYGKYVSCYICGFDRAIDICHIVSVRDGGTSDIFNLISLCPNHHHLFDNCGLSESECMQLAVRADLAMTFHKMNSKFL